MKKVLLLILTIALVMSLCACGNGNDNTVGPTEATPTESNGTTESTAGGETTTTIPDSPIFIDPETITAESLDQMIVDQGNRHGMNAFAFDNSWIYGAWAGKNATGEVVKVRYDNSDWTVIDSDTNGSIASCQAVKSGYIYYSRWGDTTMELVKVRSSGEDAKVIVSQHQGSIQIVDNYIYYTSPETWKEDGSAVTDDSSHLFRCDLNGENVEEILKTPVYYFTVFGDYILYQDDRDNMTLHIYDMVTDKDERINNQRSFWPIFDGSYIYYLSDSGSPEEYQHALWRMSLDGKTNEKIDLGCYLGGLLLRGDYVYYINMDDSARVYRCHKDGSEIELVTQDANVSTLQWVNGCLAYMTRNPENGYISGVFLCDADGADKIEFTQSDDYWYLG